MKASKKYAYMFLIIILASIYIYYATLFATSSNLYKANNSMIAYFSPKFSYNNSLVNQKISESLYCFNTSNITNPILKTNYCISKMYNMRN